MILVGGSAAVEVKERNGDLALILALAAAVAGSAVLGLGVSQTAKSRERLFSGVN